VLFYVIYFILLYITIPLVFISELSDQLGQVIGSNVSTQFSPLVCYYFYYYYYYHTVDNPHYVFHKLTNLKHLCNKHLMNIADCCMNELELQKNIQYEVY